MKEELKSSLKSTQSEMVWTNLRCDFQSNYWVSWRKIIAQLNLSITLYKYVRSSLEKGIIDAWQTTPRYY